MNPTIPLSPEPLEQLQDTDGTVYTFDGICELDGLRRYRWFDHYYPDIEEMYEVSPEERDDLIACGWWKMVTEATRLGQDGGDEAC